MSQFTEAQTEDGGDGGPRPMGHDERLALAHEIAGRLHTRYGDDVEAIGIYGSLARGTDGPYSDIEMLCVLRTPPEQERIEWCAGAWKAEVDFFTVEELLRQAALVEGRWSLTHGAYRHIQPLHDPESIFSLARDATYAVSDEVARAVIEDMLVGDLYELLGKIRNDAARGWTGALPTWAVDLVRRTALMLALAQRHCYTSGAWVLAEALDLSDQPAGFAPLARLVMAGQLNDARALVDACNALWSGVEAWAAAHGFTIVSAERIPISYQTKRSS